MISWRGVSSADSGSASVFALSSRVTAHVPSAVIETAGPSTVTTPNSPASRRNATVGSPCLAVHDVHWRRAEEGVIPSVAPSAIAAERMSKVKLGRRDSRLLIDVTAVAHEHAGPHLPGELTGRLTSCWDSCGWVR